MKKKKKKNWFPIVKALVHNRWSKAQPLKNEFLFLFPSLHVALHSLLENALRSRIYFFNFHNLFLKIYLLPYTLKHRTF